MGGQAAGGRKREQSTGIIDRVAREWFVELTGLLEFDFEHLVASTAAVARLKRSGHDVVAPSFATLSARSLALDSPVRRDVRGWVVRLRAARGEAEDFYAVGAVVVELTLAAEDLRDEARWQSVVAALAEALRRALVVVEVEGADPGDALDAFGLFRHP
jgi:hypothetical protein